MLEAIQVARQLNHSPTQDLVAVYQIWSFVVTGEFDSAMQLAQPIGERLLDADRPMDNPTYNSACALAACLVFDRPEES